MLTKNELAAIHILKNQLGLSEDEYRATLAGYGVESAKNLTKSDYRAVMNAFNEALRSQNGGLTLAQERLIRRLVKATADVRYPMSFIAKVVRREVSDVSELTKREAVRVIDAFKRYTK